ncbi:hypothetical protein ACFV2U_52175 [Streptomyces sp. NPDC059697]|uniref:hypothetical protein n=1 Tax=Streptomyces sp. NPDC059697 TaxID=3346912 RepID=UPI003693683D
MTWAVDAAAVTDEAVEDLVGGLVPYVGVGAGVPVLEPGADAEFESEDGAVDAALEFHADELGSDNVRPVATTWTTIPK